VSRFRSSRTQPAVLGLAVIALLAGGCADRVQQVRARARSLDREQPERPAGMMTQEELRQEVLRFANRYMSAIGEFGVQRVEDSASPPEARLAALRLANSLNRSTLEIAVGPGPVVNLLDMMVLTSLTRQRAEARMEVGGYYRAEDLAAIVPTLARLEKDVWALGARVLAPEQRASLRDLIDAWLRENPDQEYVAYVRLDDFAAEHGANELAGAWTSGFMPGLSLVPEVDKAAAAADELRLLLERYFVYLRRLPNALRWQTQEAYYQFILQPEVKQLLANANQVAASTERLAAFAERLPEQEERLRELSADLRQTILAGTELAGGVDQAVGSADAFLVGIKERSRPGGRRFDIVDWQNTAVEIGEASRQLHDTLKQVDALVSSQGWNQNLPTLIEALERAESESEELVNHAFRQSLLLIVVFLGGSLATALVYQWARRKLFGPAARSPIA
jgi:hypothetical protein